LHWLLMNVPHPRKHMYHNKLNKTISLVKRYIALIFTQKAFNL
jgi:hypothetical protein